MVPWIMIGGSDTVGRRTGHGALDHDRWVRYLWAVGLGMVPWIMIGGSDTVVSWGTDDRPF